MPGKTRWPCWPGPKVDTTDEAKLLSRRILAARFLVFVVFSAALGAVCSQAFILLRDTENEAFRRQFLDAAELVRVFSGAVFVADSDHALTFCFIFLTTRAFVAFPQLETSILEKLNVYHDSVLVAAAYLARTAQGSPPFFSVRPETFSICVTPLVNIAKVRDYVIPPVSTVHGRTFCTHVNSTRARPHRPGL